ncbi:MAG: lipid-binding SYLF domain-containing protein [Thermodesulfobacteriota bacterium]|nr:lipid-binding SYLF domain-containing protein [Thermodesulfobacteriota bacterium]
MKAKTCSIYRFLLKSLSWTMWFSVFTIFVAYPYGSAANAAEPKKVMKNTMTVLTEILNAPDGGIPDELLARCEGLAIFPSVYKGGFVVGASYGNGLMVVRNPKTGKWYGPAFLQIGSGSFGWQIGVQATDLIMVIMNQRGVNAFFNNNITLGGDISVAAGPVGRKLKAATDLTLKAEVYSYSRSKGFFAGLSLEGAYLHHDYKTDEALYGRILTPAEILSQKTVSVSEQGRRFLEFLDKNCP